MQPVLVVASVLGAVASLQGPAAAHGLEQLDIARSSHHVAVGGSAAYAYHPGAPNGLMWGFDFTYSPTLGLWLGGGLRSFEDSSEADRSLHPYVEAGVWAFINIGGGYTLSTGEAPGAGRGPHLFLGLPVPLRLEAGLYLEPYYRVLYASQDALNEVGLLLKWTNLASRQK